ncbi:MAG: hypothetical protein Q7J45_00535, partial [bacterium]|nr:hypothetical protein [bacterium]
MIEADFSESQLQQLVNISLVEKYKLEEALVLAPILISLNAENKEGWDTAFNLKWLKKNTSKCHEGCNFFIQYKISNVLTSSGANEWKDWERDYFRFKIPHKKKNSVGKYVDNYNQFNNLVGIAAKGFTVYYATNSTTDRKQLIQSFKTNKLLDTTPFLDVSDISGAHKHVTFT